MRSNGLAALALASVALLMGQADTAQERARAGAGMLQRGQVDDAIKELRAAIALEPTMASGHLLLGQAYLAKKSIYLFAEAQAEFRQAIALDPRMAVARFYLAKSYIDLGRYDKAKEQLEAALETNPKMALMVGLLGEVERKLGKPETSIELNKKALELDPSLTPCHYHIALALLDLKREDEALEELMLSAQSKFVSPEIFVSLSEVLLKRKRLGDAESAAKKAIELDVTRAEGHLALARLYNVRGANEKALDELHLALPEGRGFPSSPYYQQLRSDIYFELGCAYQARRDKQKALEAFRQSLEHQPERADAQKRLVELSR